MDKGFMGIILKIILKPIAAEGQIQTLKKKFILVLVTFDITVLSQKIASKHICQYCFGLKIRVYIQSHTVGICYMPTRVTE